MRRLYSIVALSFVTSTVFSALAQSPATPSLRSSGEVERRVESILSQMTLEEKIDLLGGVDGFFIRDVSRLKLPRFRMADGPIGVRNFGPATAMAGGIGRRRRSDAIQLHKISIHQIPPDEFAVEGYIDVHRDY